jgi:hypothetical protein
MNCSLWENVRHISQNSSSLTLNRVCDAQGNTSSTQYHIYILHCYLYMQLLFTLPCTMRSDRDKDLKERTKCHPRLCVNSCLLSPYTYCIHPYTHLTLFYPSLRGEKWRENNTWKNERVTSKVDSACPSAQSLQWYRIQWYVLCLAVVYTVKSN